MGKSVKDIRVGTKEWTLGELFDYFYGDEIEPDAMPYDIRSRMLFLTRRYHEAVFEKSYSKRDKGRLEIDLWNSVLDMIKTAMHSIETVNMSVCSEARFSNNNFTQ